eukprot:jgi/Picre1/28585/NNA_003987.t1
MEDDIDTNVLSPRDSAATGLVMAIFSDCCAYSNVTGLVMATLELDPSVGLVFFPNINLQFGGIQTQGPPALWNHQNCKYATSCEQLERSGQGVKDPTKSKLLQRAWRLLYTTRPSSASPIQRSFTGVDGFSVFQEVLSGPSGVRVNNIVDFGKTVGFLKVEAAGSTDAQPLPDFEPRKGKGLPFGILGTSSVEPPSKVHTRIDFQFDTAAFYFKSLPLTIPYPVPFRLLGTRGKGGLMLRI